MTRRVGLLNDQPSVVVMEGELERETWLQALSQVFQGYPFKAQAEYLNYFCAPSPCLK